MSTDCRIQLKEMNGDLKTIYCQKGGYVAKVGNILFKHYQNHFKIRDLMKLGNIALLSENPCEPPKSHSISNPIDGYVVAYHRDGKELLNRFYENRGYNYLFDMKNQRWLVAKGELNSGKISNYENLELLLAFEDISEEL